MSPTSVIHSVLQSRMAVLLQNQLGGQVFTELAIETSLGVRVPDVAWGSDEYLRKHRQELHASKAPEICVEIVSPSNHPQEMRNKTRLFLEVGAIEVCLSGWLMKPAIFKFLTKNANRTHPAFQSKSAV